MMVQERTTPHTFFKLLRIIFTKLDTVKKIFRCLANLFPECREFRLRKAITNLDHMNSIQYNIIAFNFEKSTLLQNI